VLTFALLPSVCPRCFRPVPRLARSCPNCLTPVRRASLAPVKLKAALYDVVWVLACLLLMAALAWGTYTMWVRYHG